MKSFLLLSLLRLLSFPAYFVNGKVSSGNVLLSGENSVALLTKFAIAANEAGSFQLQLKINAEKGMYLDERQLQVSFFNDEISSWSKAKKSATCGEKLRFSKNSHPVVFNWREKDGVKLWSAEINSQIPKSKNDMYWYIALNDCLLEETFHSIRDAPEMEFSLNILNGNSHFSADERGMGKLHLIQICSSSLLLLLIIYKISRAVVFTKGQIHLALLLVGLATACDVASGIFELIHSSIYAMNGVGSYSFDCLASHFEAQCDAIVALVLLLVSAGWTMPSDVIVASDQNVAMMGMHTLLQRIVAGFRTPITAMKQLNRGNPSALLIVCILAFHAALAQWGRTYDDDFDTYHSLEHLPGRVLMRFRLGLGLIFLVASASVRNNGRLPRSLQPFLKKFQLVGISWFLSLPFVSIYVSSALHSHQKHVALATGAMVAQSSSLYALCWLFTADKDASPYHSMSNLRKDNDTLLNGSFSSKANKDSSKFWTFGQTKIRLD